MKPTKLSPDPGSDSFYTITKPNATQSFRMWSHAFHKSINLDEDVDLAAIAFQFPLRWEAILNILRHATIQKIRKRVDTISKAMLMESIEYELAKLK